MTTATATTLSAIGIDRITAICVTRFNSGKADAYSNFFDLVSLIHKYGKTELVLDSVYKCYVMPTANETFSTMMVFVNREVEE